MKVDIPKKVRLTLDMRRCRNLLLVAALAVSLGACGSDKAATSPPSGSAAGEKYEIVSDAEVADGFAKVTSLADEAAATVASSGKDAAQKKVDALYAEWFRFEGTVRKVDQAAYLDMEDALTSVKLGVQKGDATRATAGATALRPLAEAYLKAHPAGSAAVAAVTKVIPKDAATQPVLLTDYEISTPTVAKAGPIVFTITNGGKLDHEFLVLQTDIAPQQLKVDADGNVEEKQPGVTLVDEKEDISPGVSTSLFVNLTPGNYILLCNTPEHFKHKMFLKFVVS
jgi:uncharacterized cupredoxin-like copper-binding protein